MLLVIAVSIFALASFIVEKDNLSLLFVLSNEQMQAAIKTTEITAPANPAANQITTAATTATETTPTVTTAGASTDADSSEKESSDIDLQALRSQKWHTYRLGDWVLADGKARKMMSNSWFNATLAADYRRALSDASNGTLVKHGGIPVQYRPKIFCDLVKKRGETTFRPEQLPQPGDLVMHLRLGDVLDQQMQLDEVQDVFNYGISIVPSQIRRMVNSQTTLGWWHYLKGKCYYEKVLEAINNSTAVAAKQNDNQKKRLIIVGSAIHTVNNENSNSLEFTRLVEEYFVQKGYEVQKRLDGMPDDDMVWMSHAPFFVTAGGSFSKVAAACVQRLGGIAFTQDLGDHCWEEPRPAIDMKNYSWESHGWRGKGLWPGNKNFPPEETIWNP